MAISKIRKPSSGGSVSGGRRVTLNPKVARRSFLKLSAATAALTGAAMTTKLTSKAARGREQRSVQRFGKQSAQSAPTVPLAAGLKPRFRMVSGFARKWPRITRFPAVRTAVKAPAQSIWLSAKNG